jgi:hypothetical protein
LFRLLHEVLGCAPAIVLTIFVCKVKVFPLLEQLPPAPPPKKNSTFCSRMEVCIVNRLESFYFLDTTSPVCIKYTYVRKGCDSAYFLYMILSLWFCATHQLSSSCCIQIGSRSHPPSCASDNWVRKAEVNRVGGITICPKYGPPARRKSLLGMQQMRPRRRVAVSTYTNTPPHRTTSAHSILGSKHITALRWP